MRDLEKGIPVFVDAEDDTKEQKSGHFRRSRDVD